jgi:Mor family transcriptional regulator
MARLTKTQLIKLQKQLKTDQAIGDQFGITCQAIHQLRKKFDIPSSTSKNPQRNIQIIALYNKGKKIQNIATKFNLSIPQTYRIIKENS